MLSQRESQLYERLRKLNHKKVETAESNGNLDAADDNLVEVNAGGKIVVDKRSMLIQIKGTRLEALVSRHWNKKLSQDGGGCQLHPAGYCQLSKNERMISSKDSPPSPPSVNEEHIRILWQQIKLFGLRPKVEFPHNSIIKDKGNIIVLMSG